MKKMLNKNLLTRRELLKGTMSAALGFGIFSLPILKTKPTFASSVLDVEEPCRNIHGERTWKACSELTNKELETYQIDLTPWEKTPRDNRYLYVSAELNPPYTATEIIYLLTVGQYFPWWTHEASLGGMMVSNRGGINFYTGQREIWSALAPDTLKDYLFSWSEDKVYLWAWDKYYTPIKNRYYKILQNIHRCGKNYRNYSDKWEFIPDNKKTTTAGEALYSDKYWGRDFLYGDTMMIPWYYTWRFLGVDTLYNNDIVRFPKARREVIIRNWDGEPIKRNTFDIKIMGNDYPAYTEDGGVPCYVLEGNTNSDFFTPGHSRLILWVDIYACRELRRERYDLDNNLVAIMEKRNRLELKDKGRWGYSFLVHLAWDLRTDHMSVEQDDFHRPPRTFKVDPKKPEKYFRPNPEAMAGEMFPVPMSTMIFKDPEMFYLRPKLMADKFPQNRKFQLTNKLLELIKAQNKKEELVFL